MSQFPSPDPRSEEPEELHGLELLDDVSDEVGTRRRGPARWLFVVAGLVVLVLAIVGITSLTSAKPNQQAAQNLAGEVRGASDVKELTRDVAGGGTVRLEYSQSKQAFAVQLDGLPDAPSNSEYQVAVTTNSVGQKFEIVGLLGAQPGKAWYGYRGLNDVLSVHITPVAQGGEESPGEADVAEFKLQDDGSEATDDGATEEQPDLVETQDTSQDGSGA